MIDERNGGTIWQFLFRGSRNNQTNLRAGWLFLYFFTKNQLPEGEWIFRLFPEAWRPKINGKAGSMLNVLSSINEAFCFTFVYARNIPTNPPRRILLRAKILLPLRAFVEQIEFANHLHLHDLPPQFSPPFFSSIKRIPFFREGHSKDRELKTRWWLRNDSIEKQERLLVSISGGRDIKSDCGDMQPESGCIIWPVAKGDQLLPVRCTFDLPVRQHFAWLTTPSR